MSVKAEMRMVQLKTIKMNPKNVNVMDKETYDGLVRSMKRQGWLLDAPVLRELDDKSLRAISGHHRIKAGIEAEIKETFCKVLIGIDDMTEHILLMEANQRRGELSIERASELIGDIIMTYDVAMDTVIESVGFKEDDVMSMGLVDYGVDVGDLIIGKEDNKFIEFKFGDIKGKAEVSVYNDFVKLISGFDKYKLLNEKIKEIISRCQKTSNPI